MTARVAPSHNLQVLGRQLRDAPKRLLLPVRQAAPRDSFDDIAGFYTASVVRTAPSPADAALLEQLRSRGHAVSSAQLERWRQAGILPPHARKHLGRGRGSISICSDTAVDIAEAMAMTTRRGRSVYEAILRVFTVDPRRHDLFEPPRPQIPEQAIRSALTWFVKVGDQSLGRRIQRAVQRSGGDPDVAISAIRRLISDHYRLLRAHPESTAEYRPPYLSYPTSNEIGYLVDLSIAEHFGDQEIGSDRLAEVIAKNFPRGTSITEGEISRGMAAIKATFIKVELAGNEGIISTLKPSVGETIERLAQMDILRIRETRDKLACVAEMGHLYQRSLGSQLAAPMATRMFDASTASIEANMLLYSTIPIATSLNGEAWHRMSALLIMVLVEDAEALSDALDSLAVAAIPGRFDRRSPR